MARMEDDRPPDVRECVRCPALVESRTRIVNGDGQSDASLLLIGEAPGRAEDDAGKPFVGRSGAVLESALEARGLDRSIVRITNCVRCRPPENRDPRTIELSNCRSFLDHEIAVVDPRVVLTLGRVPAEQILERRVKVTDEAGTVVEVALGGARRTVVIGLHPAATLYNATLSDQFEAALDRGIDLAALD